MTEICQITEWCFDFTFVSCLQYNQPYAAWNRLPRAPQIQSGKPIHCFWGTWFSSFLSFGGKKTLQEDITLLCRSLHWQLYHIKHRLPHRCSQSLTACPHPTEHLSWLPRGWLPFLVGLWHQPQITQFHVSIFILSQLLFKLGRSLLTLQKSVF